MGNQFSENFDFINKARNGSGFNYCILKYSPWIDEENSLYKKIGADSLTVFEDNDENFEQLYQAYKEYPPLLMDAFISDCESDNLDESTVRQVEDDQSSIATSDHFAYDRDQGAGDTPNYFITTIIDVTRIRFVIDIQEFVGHGILFNWLKKAKQVIRYGYSIVWSV